MPRSANFPEYPPVAYGAWIRQPGRKLAAWEIRGPGHDARLILRASPQITGERSTVRHGGLPQMCSFLPERSGNAGHSLRRSRSTNLQAPVAPGRRAGGSSSTERRGLARSAGETRMGDPFMIGTVPGTCQNERISDVCAGQSIYVRGL